MSFSRIRGLVAAASLGASASWNISNIGAVPEAVSEHFGVGLATVGLFTTALFLAQTLLMLPAGRLIDRFGPREVGLVALVILASGNALALVSDGLPIALALRFVVGFAVGIGLLAGPAYVKAQGGRALHHGLYGGAVLSIGGLAVAVSSILEPALGWRSPFASALAMALLAMPILLQGPDSRPTQLPLHVPMLSLMLDRRLLRFAVAFVSTFGLAVILSNWAVTLLVRRADVDPGVAGVIASLILGMSVLGRPLGGVLNHRWPGSARTFLIAAATIGSVATLVLANAQPVALTIAAAALVGMMAGLPYGILLAGLGRVFPRQVGVAIGAMSTYAVAAVVVGTPLIGMTFSLPGNGLIGFAAAALIWFASIAGLPRSEMLEGPRPRCRRRSPPRPRHPSPSDLSR